MFLIKNKEKNKYEREIFYSGVIPRNIYGPREEGEKENKSRISRVISITLRYRRWKGQKGETWVVLEGGAVSRSTKSVVALSRSASPNRVVKMTVNASADAKADDGRRRSQN